MTKEDLAKEADRIRFKRYYELHKEQVRENMRKRYYERRAKLIESGQVVARPQGRPPSKTLEEKMAELIRRERETVQKTIEARTIAMSRVAV